MSAYNDLVDKKVSSGQCSTAEEVLGWESDVVLIPRLTHLPVLTLGKSVL